MTFLSDNDKLQIAQAIEQAERNTRGEFVTVIAQAADDYLYIPTLWAALVALLVPGVFELAGWLVPFEYIYGVQVMTFFGCALLFRWTPIKRLLIPKRIKQQRAHRLAQEQFFLQNLHATDERTGVLLFVSITEHYVEVIADKGINDVVSKGVWDEVVNGLILQVKAGEVTKGFLHAVKACGDVLAEHFPATDKNRNELPNHLIEI
jgi:putative membrane protein